MSAWLLRMTCILWNVKIFQRQCIFHLVSSTEFLFNAHRVHWVWKDFLVSSEPMGKPWQIPSHPIENLIWVRMPLSQHLTHSHFSSYTLHFPRSPFSLFHSHLLLYHCLLLTRFKLEWKKGSCHALLLTRLSGSRPKQRLRRCNLDSQIHTQ